ncbi:MAG: DUF3299 domain-containing protein [Planctomycetes bacterium]|nr:DUF3299 domain-containing protein [Planctomycetota bacterium]
MRRSSALLALCCLLSACAEEQELGPAELTARGERLDAGGAPPSRGQAAEAVAPAAVEPAAVEPARPEAADPAAARPPAVTPEETTSEAVTPGAADTAPEVPDEPGEPPAPESPQATTEPALQDGNPLLTWDDLTLPDERVDDLVDALLYPESYPEEDRAFPEAIARHDGQVVTVEGYMVPLEWAGERVRSLMLVGDLLACCFGTAPEPDAWVEVVMEGEGAEYFVQLPVLVTGTFRIEGLDDGTGYAAGCYTMKATSLELNED